MKKAKRIKIYEQAIEDYSNPEENIVFSFDLTLDEYGFCHYFRRKGIDDFESELTELISLKPSGNFDKYTYWWDCRSPITRLKKLKIALGKALDE